MGLGRVRATRWWLGVVTSTQGVLIGKRRDGIPRWTLPGGTVEPGESPAQAVGAGTRRGMRPTGPGRRRAGSPAPSHHRTGNDLPRLYPGRRHRTSRHIPRELLEVCWLDPDQVHERMPDLYAPVRDFLDTLPGPAPDPE